MAQFLSNLLTASFHGSIVILAVIVLRMLLKRTPRKFFCMLWLLAGIRLLMPFEIQSDLSLQPNPEPMLYQMARYERLEISPQTEMTEENVSQAPALPVFTPAQPSAENTAVQESQAQQPVKREVNWSGMIPWIWISVASCFLIYTLYSYIGLRLLVREAIRIDGGWECDRIETAFILGFVRPRIYIPMGLSPMVRKYILAHERTHLEKGDHWFKMIGFVALALHWFNPLVWIAYTLLCKDIEFACDERVVQFMGLPERKEYSAALLNCSTNRAHFAACPVAFGEVSVKHRIKSVLGYRKPGFWISLAGVLAILFVAVCFVTSPQEMAVSDIEAGEQIIVSNVDELLASIGPHREIILEPGTYNLCDAKNYGKETGSEYYTWAGNYDGSELVLRNLENLTIRGGGKVSTTIETDPRWVNVLRLQNSSNIKLEGFTAGHTRERGECTGGVVYLEGCNDITMESLGLYGCGVVGLTADLCKDITLRGSDLYECSSSAAALRTSSNVTISNCRVYDIGLEEFGGYAFLEIGESQNVTVENCAFSESALSHLMVASGAQVTLRNNLFSGNRIRGYAFSINGENVILENNRFEENSIRSWYSSYGHVAYAPEGDAITEAMLKQWYPADPLQPTQPQLQIIVSNVDELIAAIGPNKEIILDGQLYDFSKATGYGTSSGEYFYWEDVFDGPGLVIRNVDNMTIRSNDGNVKNHTVAAIPRYADVLAFSACSNVTLSGFTAGHTKEPGSCAGGVIEFRDCDNMTVDNCGLYGCGILGVYAEYSQNIQVVNSDIYECSLGGIQMRNTDRITVNGNTFRDLGGEETRFISCTNVNLNGQLLNPQADAQKEPIVIEPEQSVTVRDEKDMANLTAAVKGFIESMLRGDAESMRLYLSSGYELPVEIPEKIIGSKLGGELYYPLDYAADMESRGCCQVSGFYADTDLGIPQRLTVEMCREMGAWKVQYFTVEDTEVDLLDKDLYHFLRAYLEQDLAGMEQLLSEEYTKPIEVYLGNANEAVTYDSFTVADTVSNASLTAMDTYSAAIPFKKTVDSAADTYLNVVLQRRKGEQTDDGGKFIRTQSEWVVLDYGIEPGADLELAVQPDDIRIEMIEEENYTGVAMLIRDPSRVFLGTSTENAFSADIPGKRINEMFDVYPQAVAAVNAGDFFDDGTDSAAVGSYPIGIAISGGEILGSPAGEIGTGLAGFAGFNHDNVLVVSDHNLTKEEVKNLEIRDGVGLGPALIIHSEIQPAAEDRSGYAPRTAIGQKADGTVILLCINGRVFNSLGASYEDVAREMIRYGAVNACMMHGGSATGMMYRPDLTSVPQLYTSISTMSGDQELTPRRLPTYWMVAAK